MKCLFAMHRHDNKPLPIIATPITRKSLTPANGRGQRKQATGVCYLSPTKEGRGCGQSRDTKSHDTHVTEEGEKEAKSTVDIFKTPQILPRRVPLEPKMVQCPPKPVFPPVVRALSEPRQSSAIHSTTFLRGNVVTATAVAETITLGKRGHQGSLSRPLSSEDV